MERREAQAFSDRKERPHRKVHRSGAARRSIPSSETMRSERGSPAHPAPIKQHGRCRAPCSRASPI